MPNKRLLPNKRLADVINFNDLDDCNNVVCAGVWMMRVLASLAVLVALVVSRGVAVALLRCRSRHLL